MYFLLSVFKLLILISRHVPLFQNYEKGLTEIYCTNVLYASGTPTSIHRLSKFNSADLFNLSLNGRLSIPFIIFVALPWALFISGVFF